MVNGGRPLGSGDTVNIFNGNAEIVVQFRDNYGDIRISAPPESTPVERATHALAEAVFRQWREEAKIWDVGGDRPALAVHWKPRTRRADHTENVGGTVLGRGDRPADLVTAFLGLRQRRLAILGGAGSGKTALAVLLTLELLRRRLADGRNRERLPVPVLLSMASWVPDREEFGAWFTRRLAEDYPGLPRVEGRHPARELWSGSGSVLLPVLDGLDEMPGERRSAAVKALNRAMYDGRPLILTCRTLEFDSLWSEVVLRSAAVVEAQPIAVREAVTYLTLSTAPELLGRWDRVFVQMHECPDGAVATALSTPLMLWLARTVYAHEWSEPAELIEEARFPSRRSVEDHLLDGFVPSAFTGEMPSDDRWEAPRRWSAVRARRYLGTLARHLHRQHTTELAWWRLHRATAPRLLALPVLVALGVLVSEAVTLLGRAFEEAGGVSPGLTSQLGGGVVAGYSIQLLIYTWYPTFRFGEPRRGRGLSRPVAALRSAVKATSPSRMLAAALIPLIHVGGHLSFVVSTPPVHGQTAWRYLTPVCMALAFVLAVLFTAPSDTAVGATTPQDLMRGERITALVTLLVIAPLIGVGVGMMFWTDSGARAVLSGTTAWIGAAATLILVSPWSRWTLARTSMALTGRGPWSLMRFLRDAHRQGVLRQTGGTYQFRNIRLQERLAGRVHDYASAAAPARTGPGSAAAPDHAHPRRWHRLPAQVPCHLSVAPQGGRSVRRSGDAGGGGVGRSRGAAVPLDPGRVLFPQRRCVLRTGLAVAARHCRPETNPSSHRMG